MNKESTKELKQDLFFLLNCYEIDAREVSDGMTYIDSTEAEKLSDKIMQLLTKAINEHSDMLLSKLPEREYMKYEPCDICTAGFQYQCTCDQAFDDAVEQCRTIITSNKVGGDNARD